jgi:hypothetical protein
MATTLNSNIKIYDDQFQVGYFEKSSQFYDVFNTSNNAIRLGSASNMGDYKKEAFFKIPSSVVTRQDLTSTSAGTATMSTQDEFITVKMHRRFQHEMSAKAISALRMDEREMSYYLGQMLGDAKAMVNCNNAIAAVDAALQGSANLIYDYSSTGTLNDTALVSGLAKMGDAANRIRVWVMHSKVHFDLMKQRIADKITNVADGITIYGGTPATLGRPVIVTDDAALWDLNGSGTDTYNTLGLVENAVMIEENDDARQMLRLVDGLEQLVYRFQGEDSFNVGVKGFKWDTTNGGSNPTVAAMSTSTNWDAAVTSDKDKCGIRIVSQ